MFSSNEHSLKEVMEELIRAYRLTGKLNELKVISSWNKITGPVISKHTRKIKMRDGKLFVTIDSAALRSELHYSRQKLVDLLNEEVGAVVVRDVILV
jgi:predicted nucleic acid-binding Zn ribbon protein